MSTKLEVFDTLNRRYIHDHPKEAAERIKEFSVPDLVDLLDKQPAAVLIILWKLLPPAIADGVLTKLSTTSLKSILTTLSPTECALTISRLQQAEKEKCYELLPKDYAKDLDKLMLYPEGTAGRAMDPRMSLFYASDRVDQVLEVLRKTKDQRQKDRKLYIVDEEKRLIGGVDIQDIALSDANTTLASLVQPPKSTVSAFANNDEVAEKLTQNNLELLPVVDIEHRIIGVIRHQALLQALKEESLAGLQTMVGVSPEERALSSPWTAIKKRLPWMQINLATAFLAAAVIGLFESTVAQFTALAVLLPVVAGQSGNAGAQAQAVTMRGLALREVTPRNWKKLVFKELRVGASNGIAIAVTTALGVFIWSQSAGLAIVISISMVISMSIACMSGALVPLGLSKLGQDPAQSSSIILTTITDVAGFLSFLGIASSLSFML